MKPIPEKPRIIIAQVEGSGTAFGLAPWVISISPAPNVHTWKCIRSDPKGCGISKMVVAMLKPRKEKEESVKFRLALVAFTQVEQNEFPVTTSGVRTSPCAKSKDSCEVADTIPPAELFGEKMALNICVPGPGSFSLKASP